MDQKEEPVTSIAARRPKRRDRSLGVRKRMKEATQVSIIITTYNHSDYLAQAIESALKQTIKNIEVIVVDDGSNDHPELVVQKFPSCRLIRQDNRGLASARNTGLQAGRAPYIVFLDADDVLLPNALETNLRQFAATPDCGFVYAGFQYIDTYGGVINTPPVYPPGDDPFEALLRGNCIAMHGTVMYSRDKLLEIGGFNSSLRACEDYDVYLRMARKHPVSCSRDIVAHYRMHASNMSKRSPMMLEMVLRVLSQHRKDLSGNARWARAYAEGVRSWKRFYSHQFVRGARSNKDDTWAELVRNTVAISAMAPIRFPMALGRVSLRYFRRRVPQHLRKRMQRTMLMWGGLRHTAPVSEAFGYDRGKPIDRRYIEIYLERHANSVRGRVLEIGDNEYTLRFGGSRVRQSDVLNIFPGNPKTTFVDDLADGHTLPSDAFDCIILTQTLHLLFDLRKAVQTIHRILAPGGVVLITVPWVSPIDRGEWGGTWYWSITPAGLRRLLNESFLEQNLEISHFGNTLSASAFLYGLAEHELSTSKLDAADPFCPVIVAGRAVKSTG